MEFVKRGVLLRRTAQEQVMIIQLFQNMLFEEEECRVRCGPKMLSTIQVEHTDTVSGYGVAYRTKTEEGVA